MSLYDIIDEISSRQVTKTELGDNRIWGVMLGEVVKNRESGGGAGGSGSDSADGRVCVRIPTRDDTENEQHWAMVAMPSSGAGWGHYFLPEVGDQVLLAFENGNIEKPYVIGCVPKSSNKFLKDSVDQDNRLKRIVTYHGTRIVFEDDKTDDEGKKDKLTLETAGQQLQIRLDNENQTIRIGDKAKQDYIEMNTKEDAGSLKIVVKSKIEIKVGDKITMILNGEAGKVTIDADDISLKSKNSVAVKSDNSLKLEASNASVNGSSTLKVESGGRVSISGQTVSVGG